MGNVKLAGSPHHGFPDFDSDVWKLADLGFDGDSTQSLYKLTFTPIEPEWFKRAIKEYIYRRLQVLTPGSCASILDALTCFARFLTQHHIASPAQFDRPLMLAYLSYLTSRGLKAATRATRTVHLKTFLSICGRESLGEFPAKELLFDDDIACGPKPLPRAIPEDVLTQLNRHLDSLTHDDPFFHWRSVLLVMQECGMRISEALKLPFGCIEQDQEGDWFIRFPQTKTHTEHSQPISKQCAAVIQEQQASVTRVWGDAMGLLFPNREGRAYTRRAFATALDKFGAAKGIRDATGRLWKFQPHQFRHTVGTRLINNGMSSYHVQLMLGHKSPQMTERYARVHHHTLKTQYQEYLAKRVLVDLSGHVLTERSPAGDGVDLKILTKGLQAQTLPNGYCGYPVAQGPCPHSNACLSCRHFRTDQTFVPILRRQLAETKTLLDEATVNNWQRVIEMNRVVEANLERILPILEGSDEP
jgi:site-specific recombinase XerD